MSGVIIEVDPHTASATIEVRDEREVLLTTGRFGADTGGYRAMLWYCRQWPKRTWAVESGGLLSDVAARRQARRPARRAPGGGHGLTVPVHGPAGSGWRGRVRPGRLEELAEGDRLHEPEELAALVTTRAAT
jgi:hypothetical protein